MTLYRQLLVFILMLFFVLFTCTWIIKLQSTRTFLEDQLESHAQDTATSLGLSISPHIAENDMATVDTMINAVFDRGYYSRIILLDLEEKPLIERNLDVVISNVPAWFIHTIPLKTPEASTIISSGWRQMGSLHVKSHLGFAYKTLWDSTITMAKVYAAIGALALLLGTIGLRFLLQPLRRIERQAEDLCKKQYTFQAKLPRTRELRSVVTAMNSMTAKVKQMFDEQAKVADRLRKNTYSDVLTGLGNRRYLQGQVAARMGRRETQISGAFLLIQVHNLLELNLEKGYQFSDQLLQKMAKHIRESTRHLKNAALARISGGTFAVFLPEVTAEDACHTAGEIARGMAGQISETVGIPKNVGHVGGVSFDKPTSFGQLLSEADQTLSSAQTQGPNAWLVRPLSSEPAGFPQGQQDWKKVLDQVLTKKTINLFGQSAVMTSNPAQQMHLEIFSRITLATGQLINAGIFIPLAERLQCIAAIDRIVLEQVMQIDRKVPAPPPELAVNISPSSLKDASFTAWILSSLSMLPATAPRMVFEFSEFSATRELITIQNFTREVKSLGHSIGLDHFGQSFASFGYLKSLQPKYVKIDKAFTDDLKREDSDSHFFIGSLAGVAHTLDILVIAEGVEEEKQYQTLRELNIDGIQGYYIDQPRAL